jgi:hypothetical protein
VVGGGVDRVEFTFELVTMRAAGRYLILLVMLYTSPAETEIVKLEWWAAGEFGACTATDIREYGMCGALVVKRTPDWGR